MMSYRSDEALSPPLKGCDAADLVSIRRHIVIARKQLADGEGVDGEIVFARLREEYVLHSSNGR